MDIITALSQISLTCVSYKSHQGLGCAVYSWWYVAYRLWLTLVCCLFVMRLAVLLIWSTTFTFLFHTHAQRQCLWCSAYVLARHHMKDRYLQSFRASEMQHLMSHPPWIDHLKYILKVQIIRYVQVSGFWDWITKYLSRFEHWFLNLSSQELYIIAFALCSSTQTCSPLES